MINHEFLSSTTASLTVQEPNQGQLCGSVALQCHWSSGDIVQQGKAGEHHTHHHGLVSECKKKALSSEELQMTECSTRASLLSHQ